MAYQNVGTPRFYINALEWLSLNGDIDINEVFKINPTNLKLYNNADFNISADLFNNKAFVAALGHKFTSDNHSLSVQSDGENLPLAEVVNIGSDGNSIAPEYDGWSLATTTQLDSKEQVSINLTDETNIGSIVVGSYYDMPHSPDLNLKLLYEYDGVKTIQTKGGATLSNASYTKPADWGEAGAWQLNGESNYSSGLRIWDLSFSYLSASDVFPEVAAPTYYEAGTNYNSNNPNENTLLDGDDFFSVVWNKTMGGHFKCQSTNGHLQRDRNVEERSYDLKQIMTTKRINS